MWSPGESHVELADGTRLLVRPLRGEDRERLVRGFHELSPRSRRLRFNASIDGLSGSQLDHLMAVDGRDHVAWVALDEDHLDRPGVGIARYVRLGDGDVAEAAVTVADAYQGRGAATVLLTFLARSARRNGLRRFRAYVRDDNEPVLAVARQIGGAVEVDAPGVSHIDVPLPSDEDDLPDTSLGRALRAAARGRLRLLCSGLFPVHVPLPGPPPEPADRTELDAWLDHAEA